MNKALLVGINNYPLPNKLEGCLNDITDMSEFLVSKCGFASSEIRLLADERATKIAIIDRLAWLLSGIRRGDRVLFHYSGHGAQLPIRNALGNVDVIHETICPVDFDFTPETSITDTDFIKLFEAVPSGVEFIWVSDSCYSGGLLKAFFAKGRRPKTFTPPVDIAWQIRTATEKRLKPLGINKAISESNVALISGCTATQESADAVFNDRPNGALTFSLLQELGIASGLTEVLTTVVANVNTFLSGQQFTQTPQLDGNAAIQGKPFLVV